MILNKKTLELDVDYLGLTKLSSQNKNKWPAAIDKMTDIINENVKTDIVSLMTDKFTNTTNIEHTVFNCVLMDSLKNFYKYEFYSKCGIPSVTLRGTFDDFQNIILRVTKFKKLLPDFNWWFDAIIPHLEKIRDSTNGKVDVNFWSKICDKVSGSGFKMISGWIADFIPYTYNEQQILTEAQQICPRSRGAKE